MKVYDYQYTFDKVIVLKVILCDSPIELNYK